MKHVIGFSGGADSQATALWVRQGFPPEDIILTNCDPGGNESPLTTQFIRWYSDNVFPVVMLSPQVRDMGQRAAAAIAERGLEPADPLTFPLLAELKGFFPSSKMQFCTEHLKLQPMRRWCYENGAKGLNRKAKERVKGQGWVEVGERPYGPIENRDGILSDGYERYAGVRRDESEKRANADEREFDLVFMCWLNRPIATWTKDQVFQFLTDAGEKWNPLYQLGFDRVGCYPCVNSTKRDIRLWNARSPEDADRIRAWEKQVGKPFFKRGWIDEVIRWSRTSHGGKRGDLGFLEAEVESGICMNSYGFCE